MRARGGGIGLRDESGVVFIEALMSIIFILYMALLVGQMFMVFHGTMAAKSAAMRSARAMALDPQLDPDAASGPYLSHKSQYLASLSWPPAPECETVGREVVCDVSLRVPTFLPAGALFFGGGFREDIQLTETGRYPVIRE